jgi:hypothetical protein
MAKTKKRQRALPTGVEHVLSAVAEFLDGDDTARLALADMLEEAGLSKHAARVRERRVVYTCTHMAKYIEEDKFGEGLVGERFCVEEVPLHVKAHTLAGLIGLIGEECGLAIDDVFIPADDDSEEVVFFSYDRLETAGGSHVTPEGTPEDWEAFVAGRLTCYSATYDFLVVKRASDKFPITGAEFDKAGIKHH